MLVDILLIVMALGLAAALFLLRRKPAAAAAGGPPQGRSAVPGAPESRPTGGRLAAALAATPHWSSSGLAPRGPVVFSVGPASGTSLGSTVGQAPSTSSAPSVIQGPGSPLASAGSPAMIPAGDTPAQAGPAPAPCFLAPRPQGTPTAVLFPGAYLEVITGEEAGNRLPLAPGDNRVGRGPNNHLRLSDRTVSNQHAIVRVMPGQVLLFDDSSTNGTFVNGQRVLQPRPLSPGDRITVGQTVLQFHLESTQAPQQAS